MSHNKILVTIFEFENLDRVSKLHQRGFFVVLFVTIADED